MEFSPKILDLVQAWSSWPASNGEETEAEADTEGIPAQFISNYVSDIVGYEYIIHYRKDDICNFVF